MSALNLKRRSPHLRRLDFHPPVPCACGRDNLTVIDHRLPRYYPTASKDWRYEVTCDACLDCDMNGYSSRAKVLAEYSNGTGMLQEKPSK